MRVELVKCKTLKQCKLACLWASYFIKVCDGYMAFESCSDYITFKNQT